MNTYHPLSGYIRTVVAESDHTGVVLAGADQGFHNYLHYAHKFKYTETIHSIVVFDQGQGIVNNLGAMRTKPLEEWGNGKLLQTVKVDGKEKFVVLNWDGTVSPVVHQYDRHKQLSNFFYKDLGGMWMDEWNQRKHRLKQPAKTSR